jgi:hypothetical protein
MLDVEDHVENYIGRRGKPGGRLSSANIADTGFRCHTSRVRMCGIKEDLATGGSTNVANPPGALSSVMFQTHPSSGSKRDRRGK